MARKEKSGFSPPALGGSSLLVVFAVLSLTVFALLSLSTVRADQRLGEASAKAVSDYYAADAQAQEILARLRSGETPEGVKVSGDTYTYRCAISDTQALEVELWRNPYTTIWHFDGPTGSSEKEEGGDFRVVRWQAVSTVDWEGWDDMRVWDGE